MDIGSVCFYCTVVPPCGIYECLELIIRTVTNSYYVGVDVKTKQAMIFTEDMIDTYVFRTRSDAVQALKEFKDKNDKGE